MINFVILESVVKLKEKCGKIFHFKEKLYYYLNGILNESNVVKDYDFIKPDFHEIDYLLDDIIKDCRNKFFHTFKDRFVYDFELTNISNNEEINFTNIRRSMDFNTEFDGLNKKIKKA